MSPTLNGEVLKSIAHKTYTATVIATALALRQRTRHESDVTRTYIELVKAGEKVDKKDFFQFWKDLQSVGVGALVFGRKGKGTKFLWNYSLKNVGRSMIEGGNVDAERLTDAPSRLPAIEKISSSPSIAIKRGRGRPRKTAETIEKNVIQPAPTPTGKIVYVALRPGFNVEINLPIDVSGREVGLLVEAMKRAL